MASTRALILECLSDGDFHSGTRIGEHLGISRAAVNKHVSDLRERGVAIRCVTGRGYQLVGGLALLDRERILAGLDPTSCPVILEVVEEIGSTNTHLMHDAIAPDTARVCIAEYQRAGRGRRGRGWVATPYRNLLLSLAWQFPMWPAAVTTLGLCAAVAVALAVERHTAGRVSLKWPNDLLWQDAKLGGLLIELEGEAGGACTVIIGVGVNVHISDAEAARIDQPWVDLQSLSTAVVDRNTLAAACIEELVGMLRAFPDTGFTRARAEWEQRDALAGRWVHTASGGTTVVGEARGIDADGCLIVADAGGVEHRLVSGDVSVRPVYAAG